MSGTNKNRGVDRENLGQLKTVVQEYTAELRFAPGSQPKFVIAREDLELILKGARDGLVAHDLCGAAVLAETDLASIGYVNSALLLGKSIDRFVSLHPEMPHTPNSGTL